ncbi:Spo0E family sporulation regulatory protein-aspartic acid phosphatase [Bacillus cereus group sp. MYBK249-1]|uniref:Spo0E family sporulation regulatory protein-aspartic acid phosphatase n=1 Tax=unclassified Bacillus cereus group TaxID=2750818 RepID=UPI003F79CD95
MELKNSELQVIIEEKKRELQFLTQKLDLRHEDVLSCSQDLDFFVYYFMKKCSEQKKFK